jgi:abequosyltransferase
MSIKLSICIPTINREAFIGETLESIIPQVTEEVEIVIVDGGSTNNTENVIADYQKICPTLHYFKSNDAKNHPSYEGFDRDCNYAVEVAHGEYCWLFTDDDLLKPDAINTVLNEFSKGYGLIVVNSQLMNHDFSKILSNKRLEIERNEIYNELELEQLFLRVIPYMSFVGCVVINRNLWLQREKERYFGIGFIHVGVIFQAPLPAPALLIAKPYIAIRGGNELWTSRVFEIWMCKWPNLLDSFTSISEQVRRKCQPQSWRGLKDVIIYRARGQYSLKEYRKFLATANSSLWWKIVILFVAIVPSSIVKLALFLYLRIARKLVVLLVRSFFRST